MLRRWHICRFYPFCHHLETGEVFRQSLEEITVGSVLETTPIEELCFFEKSSKTEKQYWGKKVGELKIVLTRSLFLSKMQVLHHQ